MKICIVGLGYVGITTAACLLSKGNEIIGVDTNVAKLAVLESGQAAIEEPQVAKLLDTHRSRISFSHNLSDAASRCDVILVCVGTPAASDGSADLSGIRSVFLDLSKQDLKCPVLLRSTVPIGTTSALKKDSPNTDLYFFPEFLREGSAVHDFFNSGLTVIGNESSTCNDIVSRFMSIFASDLKTVTYEEAEAVKYACNAFHATKIVFANEIGRVSSGAGADPGKVMELLCSDKQLNISDRYLKPGFAYGGSCLPKDTASLIAQGRGRALPLLESLGASNQIVIDEFMEKLGQGNQPVLINGLAFKEGTDDLRYSPYVELAKRLAKNHRRVYIFDPNLENIFGDSREILSSLLTSKYISFNVDLVEGERCVLIMAHEKVYYNSGRLDFADRYELYPGPNISKVLC